MGLFKSYSHLAKPVARRRELFLLLLGAAMPALFLLPFVGSFSLFVIILMFWCMLVATLYCLYKEKKHNN
jgi:Ca2+/Na+ antiporter